MLAPATAAIRNSKNKRQKTGREQVAFLSIVANVVDVVDQAPTNQTLLMEEIDNAVKNSRKQSGELKPYWEPSTYQAHFLTVL
jgi:hypothetical protein